MRLFLINWIIHSFAILAVAALLPGITFFHGEAALRLACMFGGLSAGLRPFFRYIAIPLTINTFGIFAIAFNMALILWTTVILPGFFVSEWGAALAFIVLLSPIQAWLLYYPGFVPALGHITIRRAWVGILLIPAVLRDKIRQGRKVSIAAAALELKVGIE